MTAVTKTLAEFAANLRFEDIPPTVVERTKLLVLDLVGIAVRARFDSDSTPATFAAVTALEMDGGSCSVFGDRGGYAPPAAALLNGALAHSLDFDDTHAPGSLHPGAPVVPAALAMAEKTGASGHDLIAGIVAGYEIICRLSMALVPADHYDRGFHPTATCGAFAATAAAGRVLGLTAEEMAHAFGIALSETAGSMQYLENGAWTKRFQVGNAAKNGVVAAAFAKAGYTGASHAIEGKYGFLNAYAPHAKPEIAVADLGKVWELAATAVKPYPACRMTHAAADAASDLRRLHNIDPKAIDRVVVGLSRKGIDLTGAPEAQKRNPQNVVDGQFSMHFVAAVALRQGSMGWDDYPVHLTNADTLDLTRKVSVVNDPDVEAEYPRNLAGKVTVHMRDGTTYDAFVRHPKGEPENFVTAAELRTKFATLVKPYLGEAGEAALFSAVMRLETISATDLLRASRPPASLAAAAGE